MKNKTPNINPFAIIQKQQQQHAQEEESFE